MKARQLYYFLLLTTILSGCVEPPPPDVRLNLANILAGDRRLISNSEVAIKQGDEIKQGRLSYVVVNVDIKAPTSDVLVYISQVRLK